MKKWEAEDRIVWGLFGTSVLRNLAVGTIVVFLPVYLYQLAGLWLVVVWLAVTRLIDVLLLSRFARMISRLGFKKSVLLGQLLWVVVIYFVNLAKTSLWVLVPAGLLVPLAGSLYWISYHMLFMQTSEENFGKRACFLNTFSRWGAAIGPMIGGFLVVNSGFPGVFWFSAAMMAVAAIPILLLEPERVKWDFHLDHYWEKITDKWFRKDLLAYVGIGMEQTMYGYFWPVFLLIILGGSYIQLGIYKTIVLGVTTAIEYFIGRKIDQGGTRKYMTAGIAVMVILWLLRGGITNPMGLLGVDVLDGWVGIMVFLPFSVYSYRRAIVSEKSLYLVESETMSRFGELLAAVGVGILYVMGISWQGMVGLGIVGTMMMLFLPKIGAKQFVKLMQGRHGGV